MLIIISGVVKINCNQTGKQQDVKIRRLSTENGSLREKDLKYGAQLYLDVGFEVTLLSLPAPQTENPPRPSKRSKSKVKVKITSTITSKRQQHLKEKENKLASAKRQVSDFKRSY